jgi:hypothetical protein
MDVAHPPPDDDHPTMDVAHPPPDDDHWTTIGWNPDSAAPRGTPPMIATDHYEENRPAAANDPDWRCRRVRERNHRNEAILHYRGAVDRSRR